MEQRFVVCKEGKYYRPNRWGDFGFRQAGGDGGESGGDNKLSLDKSD